MIRTFFLLILFSAIQISLFAQSVRVYGYIIDADNQSTIPGCTIYDSHSKRGVVSNEEGYFEIYIPSKSPSIIVSHLSYNTYEIILQKVNSHDVNVGIIELQRKPNELSDITVVSSFLSESNIPVAFTTITAKNIEEKTGSRDYPEVLRNSPGVYVTRDGGGLGDNRLSIRGFQQENVALLLNGVPVSSVENGLVHWSNWTGLTVATEAIQIQRGLGASRVAMNSVGGTINIITKSNETTPSGSLKLSMTDYGNYKYSLMLSSGKLKSGTSFTFIGSRNLGQGPVDGAYIDGYSYFLNIQQRINNKHSIELTILGSPEKHGQRNYTMSIAEYEKFGAKYNRSWGVYNGKILNLSENFYHKPHMSLNHYYTINDKLWLSTAAYVSAGRGGGRYSESFNNEKPAWYFVKNNQIDFDAMFLNNTSNTDSFQLSYGEYMKGYSKNILTHFRANHYWVGALSTLNYKINNSLKFINGFHLRNFTSHLYEEVNDLMGGDFWIEKYDYSLAGIANRNQIKQIGDIININNYSMLSYGNIFSQLEYKKDDFNAFLAATITGTRYRRKDLYNYIENPLSEVVVKSGFDAKSGISFQLPKYGTLYANVGYYSREPYYKFIFIDFANKIAANIKNEKIMGFEAGYKVETQQLSTRLNFYFTQWNDKSMLSRENIQLADSTLTRSLIKGLNALHRGVEIDFAYKPVRNLTLNGVVSYGIWKWTNDVSASIYNDNQVLAEEIHVYSKNLLVGGAPQTQVVLSADYRLNMGLGFGVDWNFYDRLFADFDPVNRTDENDRAQSFRLPSYNMVDLMVAYTFKAKNYPITFLANCQNLFDKEVILRGDDGIKHDAATYRGFWSTGRSFNFSLKLMW